MEPEVRLSTAEFKAIAEWLYRQTGVLLSDQKQIMVQTRLMRRLKARSLPNFAAYTRYLLSDPGERELAIDLLTTHETFFFRDTHQFKILEEQVQHMPMRPLAIWSAACSTGEEAYSIAMTLALSGRMDFRVLGTDISLDCLTRGRLGEYPIEASARIPEVYLKKFCWKGVGPRQGIFRMDRSLIERIRFEHHNLLTASPAADFDLIFLRNVLIYFDEGTRQRVIRHIVRSLRNNGLLFLGTAETVRLEVNGLQSFRPGVYRKVS
ncbi:MAG: protein-glutamate O-methyltransferase CheR [Spirochaetales bacterium]|nr:protein-glutamate O-methyltransferase CheR [Spirochaetales bacterium]